MGFKRFRGCVVVRHPSVRRSNSRRTSIASEIRRRILILRRRDLHVDRNVRIAALFVPRIYSGSGVAVGSAIGDFRIRI